VDYTRMASAIAMPGNGKITWDSAARQFGISSGVLVFNVSGSQKWGVDSSGNETVAGVVNATAAGMRTKQAVTNVHDTTPTDAELDTAFGTPATLGRGFIGLVDDADGDTNGYICWTSDASWYFLKGTKAV
jgi:hypothetical protein